MNKRKLTDIKRVIVHCSASPYPHHDNMATIELWHKERFKPTPDGVYCGYHYFISKDGKVEEGRNLIWYGQHAHGYNWDSIGICLGGMGGATQLQFKALLELLMDLKLKVDTIYQVIQHSDIEPKKPHCAGFNIEQINYLNGLMYGTI